MQSWIPRNPPSVICKLEAEEAGGGVLVQTPKSGNQGRQWCKSKFKSKSKFKGSRTKVQMSEGRRKMNVSTSKKPFLGFWS